MSFDRPLLLLALLVVPLAVALYVLARAPADALRGRFTNLEVLASVARRAAVAAVRAAGAAPARARRALRRPRPPARRDDGGAGARDHHPRRRRLALDAGQGRRADAARRGAGGASDVPRPRARAAAGRPGRLRRRAARGRAADDRSRPRPRLASTDRPLPGLQRHGDRRRARLGGRARQADGRRWRAADDGTEPAQTIAYRPSAAARPRRTRLVSILFLSDGAQTRGFLQPLEGAELAKEAGFPVYTVALGTPEAPSTARLRRLRSSDRTIPVPPDPETLSAIAETTGGEFSEARTADRRSRTSTRSSARASAATPGEREVDAPGSSPPPPPCSPRRAALGALVSAAALVESVPAG